MRSYTPPPGRADFDHRSQVHRIGDDRPKITMESEFLLDRSSCSLTIHPSLNQSEAKRVVQSTVDRLHLWQQQTQKSNSTSQL